MFHRQLFDAHTARLLKIAEENLSARCFENDRSPEDHVASLENIHSKKDSNGVYWAGEDYYKFCWSVYSYVPANENSEGFFVHIGIGPEQEFMVRFKDDNWLIEDESDWSEVWGHIAGEIEILEERMDMMD